MEIVMMRAGHYFTPNDGGDGTCQGATVAYVFPQAAASEPVLVNLKVLQHDGEEMRRLEVPVDTVAISPAIPSDIAVLRDRLKASHEASFHLTTHCPWNR